MLTEEYEHQHDNCKETCDIDPNRISVDDPTTLPCVCCPFCEHVVTAKLTPTTITCPDCQTTVKR